MRSSSWTSAERRNFLIRLSTVVRHPALPFDDRLSSLTSPLLSPSASPPCSVIEYSYSYDMTIVNQTMTNILDATLSSMINSVPSAPVNPTLAAETFYIALTKHQYITASTSSLQVKQSSFAYHILLFNNVAVAPQYGYRVHPAGAMLTMGMGSSHRFAFIDVGARPALSEDTSDITPGELLTSSSKDVKEYAPALHTLIADRLLTPEISKHMRQFPRESRIDFTAHFIDASAMDVVSPQSPCQSISNDDHHASLNQPLFLRTIHAALDSVSHHSKSLSLQMQKSNNEGDARLAMAVARSIYVSSTSLVMNTAQLYADIITREPGENEDELEVERAGFFIDSSFVVHLPFYLFSFCDDARVPQFKRLSQHGTNGRVAGKRAIFLVENRSLKARNHLLGDTDRGSTTIHAVQQVLEMFCGLGNIALAHINVMAAGVTNTSHSKPSTHSMIPQIVLDQIERNLLMRKIDWSERVAASKAEELLNFEGLDARVISEELSNSIMESRTTVKDRLLQLRLLWHGAANTSRVQLPLELDDDIESSTARLMSACEKLASKLHAEICHQRFSQEVLIKAEIDDAMDHSLSERGNDMGDGTLRALVGHHLLSVLLSLLLGIGFAVLTFKATPKMPGQSRQTFGSLSSDESNTLYELESQTPTTHWFSTLHSVTAESEDKTKTS